LIEETRQVYEFDDFQLNTARRQLLRDGEVVPLFSKAFDVLLLLVRNNGRDLSKDEILETIWPGQIVEESNLTVNISTVRKALGEKAAQPRYLLTIPGHGYRFVANVRLATEATNELIIESQTISQVVVEEELDDDSTNYSDRHEVLRSVPPVKKMVAAPRKSFLRQPLAFTALILAAAAMAVAAIYGVRAVRTSRAAANRFRQIKLRQLANDGQTLSAAISPDGKFFAYTSFQKGMESLRLGSLDGQTSVELRPAASVSYHHVEFAPDGRSIYYEMSVDARHSLYRIPTLGGAPVKLRDNMPWFFSVAPDNTRVTFLRYVDNDTRTSVFVSNLDGSNERAVLTTPYKRNMTAYCLAWSPDGSMIAAGASPENDPTITFLFLLSVDNGQLKQLSTLPWKTIGRIAWLKDGSGILTIAAQPGPDEASQIWLVSYPGGEVRRVVNDLNTYDFDLSIAADSSVALTTTHRQINNVWVGPANDLTQSRQITFGSLNRGEGLLGVAWTPDDKIVYTSTNAQGVTIWIMDADGSNARELTPPGSNAAVPSVTADGRFIVYQSRRGGHPDIWRANIDGSDAKQLTHCGENVLPAVSPDGKWIVYRSECDATGGLWRIPIDGGDPERLTNNSTAWPWISPDSKLIACEYTGANGKRQLAVLSIEGSNLRLFDVPPQANFRYSIRWTSDGKAITYRDWGKGLWRQSLEGGPPQQVPGLPDEKIYSNGWSPDGKYFAFTRGVEMRDVIIISSSN